MLKYTDVQQNTDEWYQGRCGRITSSKLGTVMANYGKAFGEPAKKYAANIAVERLTGTPIESTYSNDHMERGHEQEPLARMLYEQETFCEVTNGGFFCNDILGCSPDGLVDGDGLIEIKSVIPHVHYANIKRGGLDPAYKWQCIGNLMFTGRDWLDFISYCHDFPEGKKLFVHRINKDDMKDEFTMINVRIDEFNDSIVDIQSKINQTNYFNQG